MKILFVAYDFPFPITSGGKNRTYHFLQYLSKKHEVYLYSFVRKTPTEEQKNKILQLGVREIHVFVRKKVLHPSNVFSAFSSSSIFKNLYFSDSVQKEIVTLLSEKKIDTIHLESFYTGYYISDTIRSMGVQQIFGAENIEHFLYRDYVNHRIPSFFKFLFQKTVANIQKEEEHMIKKSDAVIVVTKQEKQYVASVSKNPCFVIPNGVDLSRFKFVERKKTGKRLLFIGDFSYFPNVDGIQYFYKNVFEKLRDPEIEFVIVGKNVEKLSFLLDSRIQKHSFAADIVSFYESADIFISPLRIGGGTNFKIIEAMASGLAVVSDPRRASSLGAKNESELLTADTPEMFENAIEKLFTDKNLYEKITKQARKFVEENYSWEEIGKKLLEIYT